MPSAPLLSPREIEIAAQYADGATYQEIAGTLGIAPSTVRTHLSAIYRKLEVSSKLELRRCLEGEPSAPRDGVDHAAVISELALSLDEAIRREKALGAVLRIISSAAGDLEQVMQAILGHALELCDAEFGLLLEHHPENRFEARFSRGIPDAFRDWFAARGRFKPGAGTALGRMARQRSVVNIFDVRAEQVYRSNDPLRHATADLGGARSFVAIPMIAQGALVGAFTIYRQRVQPFSEDATALAQIFADQSVIALENARMISALRERSAAPARG